MILILSIAIVFLILLFFYCACVVSSKCSLLEQEIKEEENEYFTRI